MNDIGNGSELQLEIDPVLNNDTGITNGMTYKLILSTPKLDITIGIIVSIDVKRDYSGNVGDYITVDFLTYDNIYFRDIHPYKDNLELTIISKVKDKETKERYKFAILNQKATDANPLAKQDRSQLGTTGFQRVLGQCLDRGIEAIKSVTINAIYRSTTVKNLMISELANLKSYNISVDGSEVCPSLTFTKDPDNEQTYDHIIVGATKGDTVGVKALDFPSFLQNTKYGVYNGNIFTYYQKYEGKPSIFVGPLFDGQLYNNCDKKKLLIVRPNGMNYDQIENTFLEDGDILRVVVKSKVQAIDEGENTFMSDGSSYTFTNPKAIADRDISISGNSVSTDPNKRMQTHTIKDRRDANTSTNYLGTVVNLYKERSKYVKASMAIYQFQWVSCDIDLIYPGMPVCYMYYENKRGIMKLYGIVQSTFSTYSGESKSRVGLINIAVEKSSFRTNPEGDDHDTDVIGG